MIGINHKIEKKKCPISKEKIIEDTMNPGANNLHSMMKTIIKMQKK